MSQEQLVGLECTVCHRINYHTTRNQKKIKERLVLTKFCKFDKKHTEHKETKV